jgi:hypothetical protein
MSSAAGDWPGTLSATAMTAAFRRRPLGNNIVVIPSPGYGKGRLY